MESRKGRRKSGSPGARTIASPPALAIKRSDEAPVTLKGWLYKQGSDGLQLWKKRWFVLSEFCLFYYKGPNEDKVSGSILLPSYIISPLSKDDGVYRKYAFKAEHANMRTYYFAAETKDGMIQWMNSLSLASILQNENKLRPELLARELGRAGLQHSHTLPPNMAPGRQTRALGLHQQRLPGEAEGRQPLYANAPPKPKRVNNSRGEEVDFTPEQSPERRPSEGVPGYPELEPPRHRMPQERRTPEAYGRSKFDSHHNSGGGHQQKDYEEVYNNNYHLEQRRHSEEVWQYTQQQQHHQQQQQNHNIVRHPQQSGMAPRVPRPHSADFLEYEAEGVQRPEGLQANHPPPHQPQRPKSCIGEKVRPDDFWSEEVYAQKMRESAGWQYDQREVRPQSRGARNSISRSGTAAPALPEFAREQQQVHVSPPRSSQTNSHGSQGGHPGQVPPPAFYQDQSSRRDPHRTPPHQQQNNSSYQEDQEVAALRLTPHQYRAQQEAWFTQQREAQEVAFRQAAAQQRPHSRQTLSQQQIPPHQQQQQQFQQQSQQQPQKYQHPLSQYQQQQQYQQQHYLQQQQYLHHQQQQQHYQQQQQQQQHNHHHQQQQQHLQEQHELIYQQDRNFSQQSQQQHQYGTGAAFEKDVQQSNGRDSSGDTRVTMPPSFPQPQPRKLPAPQTPTMYQNLPSNSQQFQQNPPANGRAYSDPRPPVLSRLESVTPNPRVMDRVDSDNSRDSGGDFRRSASARLPRNKNRGDALNNTFNEESGDSGRSGEQVGREESMKRLLEWKQRMLQSPLTRKSSRNASRTQTPTNSDSPVPSLNNDDIRKKVLEELQQPSTPTVAKERRLSRKGSSGSRSSRSRSSPRIAANKSQMYSSDDDDLPTDPRASRKRTKSASGRSRNPSRDSKRNSLAKSRSRSASLTTQATGQEEQPEYININSLKSQEKPEVELTRGSKIKPTNAIGPDDWYRDDFDFDKSHPFLDDPMLLKQYAQILDMKYRDSSTERIEEMLKQGSLIDQAQLERSLYSESQRTMESSEPNSLVSHTFSTGRYPDSGYDTLKYELDVGRSQMCVDIDIKEGDQRGLQSEHQGYRDEEREERRGPKDKRQGCRDERKIKSWHSSNFADFQLMEQGGDTVLLSIEGHGEELENTIKRSPRDRAGDKVDWQLGKSYKDLRREKEAPPKNVVKERLKSFESTGEPTDGGLTPGEERPRPESRGGGEKFKLKGDLFKQPSCPKLRDEEEEESSDADDKVLMKKLEASEKKLEHKRSVKDLLSDFERKSKALQEKEEGRRVSGIGSYLLQDSREAGGRRVFSDTETLMYETSSEEDQSEDELSPRRPVETKAYIEAEPEKPTVAPEPPPLPPKRPPPSPALHSASPDFQIMSSQEMEETPSKDNKRKPDKSRGAAAEILNEETYLTMTPSKSLSSLPSTAARKAGHGVHNSVTSLTSSHSSLASATGNRGSMTPTEALIHSSTTSINHSRTPSQSLVMEHFGLAGRQEETYVEMNEDGSKKVDEPRRKPKEPVLARQSSIGARDPLDTTLTYEHDESPRYCEIEEKSHYELLCNARTAMTQQQQRYEVVYQEILGGDMDERTAQAEGAAPSRRKEMEPLRPIEGLPDILGNAPTNKGNSSSDADDESSKDFDALETVRPVSKITLDDTFRPASFYLSHCKARDGGGSGDSSDSDLVSPPPVPSSPPPMEEVLLGFSSLSDRDSSLHTESLNNLLSAAKSAHAFREQSGRIPQEEMPLEARRPSVSSRTSASSARSPSRETTLSPMREMALSPTRHHGSQQSLGSRELPPLPTGSQQSLASREVQAMVAGRGSREVLVISPFHSREGSLDNETFLRPSFTQGMDHSQRSTSAELSSSDTANYEQEYRRYHLENIQEVSNTLERTESGSHNTSIISQDLNISYNSVYDSRLQQGKVYKLEDHPVLQKRKSLDERRDERQPPKYFQPDPHSAEIEAELQSPRGKVPYYVSDLEESMGEETGGGHFNALPTNQPSEGSFGMVDVITQSMNALDVESKSYFEDKNQVENERIAMLRRSYTPDPYLTKNAGKEASPRQSAADGSFESNNVSRSKSLEGLLGDSPGVPKANLGYAPQTRQLRSPHNFMDSPKPVSVRGYQPPPPPLGVPPLDLRASVPSPGHRPSLGSPHEATEEDEAWAENLRRASLRQHRAASTPPSEDRIRGYGGPAPPTAPKPKTPVHFQSTAGPPAGGPQGTAMEPPLRNSAAPSSQRAQNFLEHGLPTPNNGPGGGPTHNTSRPSSRGAGGRGRPADMAARSMTLPARIKYSQDLSSGRPENSFEDNSPRTRTSKSGLPEDSEVVPPSPRGPDPHGGHSLPRESHQRQRDPAEDLVRSRRRNPSSGARGSDLETLKRKLGGNLSNITAGDLLGKSHEELVLILIQLRRQATSITEAADTCRAELDNMRNTGEQGNTQELRQHTWELEEQLGRLAPVISLVDNMVKLGTLYRGQDSSQPLATRGQSSGQTSRENSFPRSDEDGRQGQLRRELQRVQAQLAVSHRGLEESGHALGQLEHDLTGLTMQLNARGGHREMIQARIAEVQETASNMQRRRLGIMRQIQELTQKEDLLTNEIRPSPTGVAGAEPVPQRGPRQQDTWYETDIDNNFTRDRGPETEEQIRQESKVVGMGNSSQAMYVNTYIEEQHNYENYENFRAQERLQNPYEDEVATVHSEGVASQAPMVPPRDGDEWVQARMGDISEADERVQRFYGILPKEVKGEVKTPRMVKQASKKNSKVKRSGSGEEDSESLEVDSVDEEDPPPPLPRGNFTQMHNFLSDSPYEPKDGAGRDPSRGDSRQNPGNVDNMSGQQQKPTRTNFRLGDISAISTLSTSRPPSRPGSSLSAHERLFGTSREESLSPDMSPVKSSSIASSDSQASSQAMLSPVFKSAAARAIIEEERKTPVQIIPKARKKPMKKRHMTISGSQPAVQEALARHDKSPRTRARDDMDMERLLKPRDAPDVVRSTYAGEFRVDNHRVDNLLGVPEKINIPERYVPEEQVDERSPEERRTRLKKADSIRRMLAESQANQPIPKREGEQGATVTEDRRQREQMLALSQVLARQVMEKSRVVAGQGRE